MPSPTPVERASLSSERSTARQPSVPMAPPVTFPGYELLAEIGRGGMGVVYKARQQNLNRLVALKVILAGPLASADEKTRFRAEAEAAARLHHPNIVQVFDVGEYAGFSYMALELVEGHTLRTWQNGAPVEPRTAARLMTAVARAVQHAHEQGIVHRDVKPANILLQVGSGQWPVGSKDQSKKDSSSLPAARCPLPIPIPKVTDFGLAKALTGGTDLTATGVACGTPNYMSPEQVKGKPISPAMDVYGLGAVLYELLTGRPPFVGTDAGEVMSRIARVEPVGVRGIVPAVPRDLAVIAARCLEKEPGRRYATAQEVAEDLERFLAGVSIVARPIGSVQRAWRWSRRNPALAGFLACTTLATVVTGGLAIALAHKAAEQRQAREDTDTQRRAAEAAGADLRAALETAETQRKAAATAKTASDRDAARANDQQHEAEAARGRAEANLKVAGAAIRDSVRGLVSNPRFKEPDFQKDRANMTASVRQYRDSVATQMPGTEEWVTNLAEVSHLLGFLEIVNGNSAVAADEFTRAGEAHRQVWRSNRSRPDPAAGAATSLWHAGQALWAAKRPREAEVKYRESAAVIADALTKWPQDVGLRQQAYEVEERLVNLYRDEGRPAERYAASLRAVDAAHELVKAIVVPQTFNTLAAAHLNAAQAAAAAGRPDAADCHHAEAVNMKLRVREGWTPAPHTLFAYTAALIDHAGFVASVGQPDRAAELFARAVGALEEERRRAPLGHADLYAIERAAVTARFTDVLRATDPGAAEKACDEVMPFAQEALRRNAGNEHARRAWADVTAVRARVYDQTGRFAKAAAAWQALGNEDANVPARPHHDLNAVRSWMSAKEWPKAAEAADLIMRKNPPTAVWFELARTWCAIARGADSALAPEATRRAITCLELCRARGEFDNPERLKAFAGSEFDAVRALFDPRMK